MAERHFKPLCSAEVVKNLLKSSEGFPELSCSEELEKAFCQFKHFQIVSENISVTVEQLTLTHRIC